ncbi:hypothetical protein DPMN_107375 [Dreissena polymorpha]|uniref:Uncharacterized protein n=3 Tax=Dreissena polymorpha TaxID=45954 RepID=A0A9D4K719_DREPO|nr:hypothetical protein DPMN_107375 [Dreissena polymorpha]
MPRFKDENMEDYIQLLRDFEIKKRAVDSTKGVKTTIKVPISFFDCVQNTTGSSMKDILKTSGYGKKITIKGDKLRLDADIMPSFFTTSLLNTVEHVSDLLQKPECKGVEDILMVGGYSESMLLQDTIKQQFSHMKIIVPPDAGLAVLKGAVIYGHCPSAITERVSKYTYGVSTTKLFDEDKHPLSKREVYSNGEIRCVDLWSVIVTAGDKLIVGEAQNEQSFSPVFEDQKSMDLAIFVTSDKDPKFTTDVGSKQVGSVNVPLSGRGTDRSVGVRMIFGGTEITVECVEKATGRITQLNIDFLM